MNDTYRLSMLKSNHMSLTQSQLVIIRTIHERMTEFTHQQMSQESILVNMMDIMPQLKSELLDTAPQKKR